MCRPQVRRFHGQSVCAARRSLKAAFVSKKQRGPSWDEKVGEEEEEDGEMEEYNEMLSASDEVGGFDGGGHWPLKT